MLDRSGQLRLTAIDNEQIGARAKTLVGHALGSIASSQNLGHRHEVVCLVQFGLNFKTTVLALVGASVGKHHHRGDGKGSMQRRDIEALDTHRRRRQRQRAFELQERLIGAVVSVPRSHHVAHEGMARIFGCHIEQTVLFATLRPMEMAGTLALACKPLPQRLRILKLDREVYLSWNISRLVVIALKKARLELFLVNIKTLVENELAGANCSALANDEDASGGDGLLAIEPDDIDIDTGGKNDLLTIVQTPDDLQTTFDACRALKVERLGGIRHLGGQLIDDILAMARQKALDTLDVLGIVCRGNRADTRTRAAPDMVVKAGTPVLCANHIDDVFLALVGLDGTATTTPLRTGCRADGDNLAQRIYRLTCRTAIGIGSKIARSRLMTLTRVFDRGIQVALCNGDKGVALVILEVDVKVRMVLADQVALEYKRLMLGFDNDVVKARHQLHHQRDLLTLILQCHVLTHAGAQVFRLAHVDDIALGILPKVASGLCGNARNLLGKRWYVVVTGHAHLLATKQRRDLGHLKDDGKAKGNNKRGDTRNANVAKSNQNRAAKCPDKVFKRPHDAGACGST